MPKTKYFPEFVQELPRVDGKVFVITGTTSGTGFVAARTAAELGGEVLLLNRNSSRVEDALAKLQAAVPNGKFVTIACDLQDFDSVRKAAAEITSKYSKLYCLANNAGIMATPDKATKDGYDIQMQTNHLSHFLLTKELYPLLAKQAQEEGDARIVNHSSAGRNYTPDKCLERKYFEKNGGNLGGDEIKMMGGACFHRYFQTKLANSVFTYGLHNRLVAKNSKIRAIAAHPGGSDTNLGDHLNFGWHWNLLLKIVGPFLFQSQEDGSMGLLKGMMHPDAQSGVLYGPKNNATAGPAVPNPPEPYETEEAAIQMLWETSEAATGVKFEI
jgi:NAD(P)-dependent dehydrogenase (short-subunit alcohol dehydrogenase family)